MVGWLWVLTDHANRAAVNSDGATVVLEAASLLHGNLLLHGWWLSLDSWWTLDAAIFAAVIGVTGSHPALLLVVPAVVAGLVVVVGVVLARRGRKGATAWAGAALVVAVLALPAHVLASQFLVGPWHQTTILAALIAFVALRRGRFGPGWLVAVVLLTAGMLGDLMMVAYATAPVALGGLVAMLRRRSLRAGLAPLAAAAAATVLAYTIRVAAAAAGAFELGRTNPHAGVSEAVHNLREAATLGIPGMFGARSVVGLGSGGEGPVVRALHVIALLVAAAGFLWALWSLLRAAVTGRVPTEAADGAGGDGVVPAHRAGGTRRSGGDRGAGADRSGADAEPWRIDDVLVIASFGSAATYVLLALTPSPAYFRYLTATVVFSTVVAARMVTRWWAGRRPPAWRRAGLLVASVGLAGSLAGAGLQLAHPSPTDPEPALVSFLRAHHLRRGVGGYWASSITTVESSGTVTVRPVVSDGQGRLEGYYKGDVHAWFDGVDFQFVVFAGTGGFGGVNLTTAERTWGPPAKVYSVDDHAYTVLTWSRPIHVTRIEPRLAPN